MTNQEIFQIALQQSAHDCNCKAEDFLSMENKVVLSRKNEKARAYLELPFACDREKRYRHWLHSGMAIPRY